MTTDAFLPCRCGAQQQDVTTSDASSRTHMCHACGAAVTITDGHGTHLMRRDLERAWNTVMFIGSQP